MTPSNFSFLEKEFPLLHNLAASAEYHLYSDPSLLKLKQFGQKASNNYARNRIVHTRDYIKTKR